MGLTEGHWFEDEEQLTERQLERAVEDEKAAYERGLRDGKLDAKDAKQIIYKEYNDWCEMATMCCVNNDDYGTKLAIQSARVIADIFYKLFDDDFLIRQSTLIK